MSDLLKLAELCEAWAAQSLEYAEKQKGSHDLATPAIDRALRCFARADALRARSEAAAVGGR